MARGKAILIDTFFSTSADTLKEALPASHHINGMIDAVVEFEIPGPSDPPDLLLRQLIGKEGARAAELLL